MLQNSYASAQSWQGKRLCRVLLYALKIIQGGACIIIVLVIPHYHTFKFLINSKIILFFA